MKALKKRIDALTIKAISQKAKPLPLVVEEHTTDAEIERLRRNGRAVYRSNDSSLYDEFV